MPTNQLCSDINFAVQPLIIKNQTLTVLTHQTVLLRCFKTLCRPTPLKPSSSGSEHLNNSLNWIMLCFLTVYHTLPFILLFETCVSLWTLPRPFRSTFPT